MLRLWLGVIALAAVAAAALFASDARAQNPGAPVTPIPTDPGNGGIVPFEGSTATPHPVEGGTVVPPHPFMAPNGRNNIHDDAYMTDTYLFSGPLGDGAETSSLFFRECASVMFDSHGRIVTICVGLDRPVLALLDPHTLQTLAALPLPPRSLQSLENAFSDFSGGGYFFLDHQDRAVLPTADRHVLEVAITDGPGFAITRDYDLSGQVASGDGIISVLPDWSGRLWFVTRSGQLGTIDRASGAVHSRALGEGISNSFAVDETGGVFIVSDRALYRFDAGTRGEPEVSWRTVYASSGVRKPGQSDAGSGTTPTLMGQGWVAIADNADPMQVVVYRRGKRLRPTKAKQRKRLRALESAQKRRALKRKWRRRRRLICSQAVFAPHAGATDQSLIATKRSMIAENNYGYSGINATMNGRVTQRGLARVDVVRKKRKRKGGGVKRKRGRVKRGFRCTTRWTSNERAPSVVPKLSLANGLVYTYTKPERADDLDAWYLTTLDFRSGETVYRRLAGSGFGYNNNYAPVTIGPDGTAYVGVLGGLVAFP
jgi:hypothetical protein